MASFVKELELKKYTLPLDRTKEWLKDNSTPHLYCYISRTKQGFSKTFIYRYQEFINHKRTTKDFIIGKYPSIGLAQARQKAYELTTIREQGKDIKATLASAEVITFSTLCDEWISKEQSKSKSGFAKQHGRIKNYLLPPLKNRDIKKLSRRELMEVIQSIQDVEIKLNRTHDTSKRVFSLLRQILSYAVAKDYIDANPIREVNFSDVFITSTQTNYKSIKEPSRLAEFLRAVENYQGTIHTQMALLFGTHTFLRSNNVRNLKWDYIDYTKDLIIFPANTMKMRADFAVPLTKQTKAILSAQRERVQYSPYVFPSDISSAKPLSDNTLNQAIKRLGFGDELVFHGLRHTASTLLNEMSQRHGLDSKIIELCLDHKERNEIKAIYDKSQRLDERAQLMQFWSNYLDELKMKG